MTTDPKKFFLDNIKRATPQTDPIQSNLNKGLLALSQQIEALQSQQVYQARLLQQIAQFLEQRRPL